MQTFTCLFCGKQFRSYPSWVRQGYCSRQCSGAAIHERYKRACERCGREFWPASEHPSPFCREASCVEERSFWARWNAFWAKVDQRPDGCWIWRGWKDKRGYGCYNQRSTTSLFAHRVVWEKKHGSIPAGVKLRNVCGRIDCVRDEHWALGPGVPAMREKARVLRALGHSYVLIASLLSISVKSATKYAKEEPVAV